MKNRYIVVNHGENWRVWDTVRHCYIGVFGTREEKLKEARLLEQMVLS